jgi:hypothetical protein
LVLTHPAPRKIQILPGRRATGLYHRVQQDQALLPIYVEEDSRGAVPPHQHSQLVQALSQRTRERHTNGPTELQSHQTSAYLSTVLSIEGNELLTHGLIAALRGEEKRLNPLEPRPAHCTSLCLTHCTL